MLRVNAVISDGTGGCFSQTSTRVTGASELVYNRCSSILLAQLFCTGLKKVLSQGDFKNAVGSVHFLLCNRLHC